MANFPAGTYIYSDLAVPSGWVNQTSLGGRYVLGASSPGQLETTGGAGSHIHASAALGSVAGHNHGGSQAAVSSTQGNWYGTGGSGGVAAEDHPHTVTMTINANPSHGHTVGSTGSADNNPSHTVLMLLKKS